MYDEYSTCTDPPPIIATFQMTLLGHHRHLRVQFLYNTHTGTTFSTKTDDSSSLSYILRHRFGRDAIAVLCAGRVYHHEEELIRSGHCPVTGARLHVLYEEDAPGYHGSHEDQRVLEHEDGSRVTLPTAASSHDTASHGVGQVLGTQESRVKRIEGFTYHESIPTLTKTIHLQFCDGSMRALLLTNKSVEQFDQLIHCLTLYAGDRWVAVKVGEREYVNDEVLFDSNLVEGGTYVVTYRPPSTMQYLAKVMDKRRKTLYTQLPMK